MKNCTCINFYDYFTFDFIKKVLFSYRNFATLLDQSLVGVHVYNYFVKYQTKVK